MKPHDRIKRKVTALRVAKMLADYEPVHRGGEVAVSKTRTLVFDIDLKMSEWPAVDMDPLILDDWGAFGDCDPTVLWPVSVATIIGGEKAGMAPGDFQIALGMAKSAKDYRGQEATPFVGSKMMSIHTVTVQDGRTAGGMSHQVATFAGKRWIAAKDRRKWRGVMPDEALGAYCSIMASVALRQRYEWSAIFHFPNGLRLRFGTSAAGVLALFKDRDKLNHETRRSPLLHWVRRHWRSQCKGGQTELLEIMKHLRGKEKLWWQGMTVTIVPAEYEVETASRSNV